MRTVPSIMKDILLVNPWIYDFTAHDFWLKPLGLLYIASILRENIDCRINFIDSLRKLIREGSSNNSKNPKI